MLAALREGLGTTAGEASDHGEAWMIDVWFSPVPPLVNKRLLPVVSVLCGVA